MRRDMPARRHALASGSSPSATKCTASSLRRSCSAERGGSFSAPSTSSGICSEMAMAERINGSLSGRNRTRTIGIAGAVGDCPAGCCRRRSGWGTPSTTHEHESRRSSLQPRHFMQQSTDFGDLRQQDVGHMAEHGRCWRRAGGNPEPPVPSLCFRCSKAPISVIYGSGGMTTDEG